MMNNNDVDQVFVRRPRAMSLCLVALLASFGDASQSSTTAFSLPTNVKQNVGKMGKQYHAGLQSLPSIQTSSSLCMSLPDDSSLQSSRRPKNPTHFSFLKSTREAVADRAFFEEDMDQRQQERVFGMTNSVDLSGVGQVISAALLITGNTVGASIMVLPNTAASIGLAMSSAVWLGVYMINLVSGLMIAEVAINQKEASGDEAPSSFKDFVDSNLDNQMMGNCVGLTSVFINTCVLAFSITRAGDMLGTNIPGLDSTQGALGFSALLAATLSTQTNVSLSRVTSGAVTCLFATFGALLLPGLASLQDPMAVYATPGTSEGVVDAILTAAPIFVQCAIWQNIAPTVTRLLDYDRTKTLVAMVAGSAIPIIMQFAWSLAVLGGGVDVSVSSGGPVLMGFMVASLVGSSIACGMSIAGELDSLLPSEQSENKDASLSNESAFPLTSSLLAVAPALAAGVVFSGGEGATAALSYAGAYGSPLLYGLLPLALVLIQRNASKNGGDFLEETKSLVPGGMVSMSALAAASVGCVMQQLSSDLGGALSFL
mmetsp:Transcript_21504/g.28283  ORF Transcript_21504/g.28283 Transcript_21504/m.28283 type:complete len:542 (+) Transcript_21504:40-1665(+)